VIAPELMQVRMSADKKLGEIVFVVIERTEVYNEWKVLVLDATDWFRDVFPPGSTIWWLDEWVRTKTVAIL